jgi:hypothetical protein
LDQSDPNSEMKDARTGLAIFYQSVIIAVALVLAIAFAGTVATRSLIGLCLDVTHANTQHTTHAT